MKEVSIFREQIASIGEQLQLVTEEHSLIPFRTNGWTRKQILGHLIDSALNNHQRFVRASIVGHYTGPTYQQEDWVSIHGYGSMSWNRLLEHWRLQNELLSNVVERIPKERMDAACQIGDTKPVTLGFLVDDYLAHLRHHVDQIVS